MANIYANLEDWQLLQRELVVLLQCDEVLRFSNRSKLLPWKYDKEASSQEDPSLPPISHKPHHDSQQTSWLQLATMPFKAAKAEASELWLKISIVSNMPSESYGKYLGNFEIIYQLAQRLSDRFPHSMYINYTSDDVFGHLDNVMSLDEELEEELNDEIDPGISLGTTEFDWGW